MLQKDPLYIVTNLSKVVTFKFLIEIKKTGGGNYE